MPFKHHEKKRKDGKKFFKHSVKNWSTYNQALINRGRLTIWMEEGIEHVWYDQENHSGKGRCRTYSELAIESCMNLYYLFTRTLRATQGFVESLIQMMNKTLDVPHYSTLSRRTSSLDVHCASDRIPQEDIHIVIDSSGLSVHSGHEWLETKHGKRVKRKRWKKLHVVTDTKTKEILACTLTDNNTSDPSQASPLLSQIDDLIKRCLADNAYDSDMVYDALGAHNPDWRIDIVIPPSSTTYVEHPQTQKDDHINYLLDKGRLRWQSKNHYGERAHAENTFSRYKAIFGEKLLTRGECNQLKEVHQKLNMLNKMTNLGMTETVKVAA